MGAVISTLEPLTVSPTGNPWVPVSNLTEFQNMNATDNYYLTADIDGDPDGTGNNFTWAPWPAFSVFTAGRRGWFDGRGHTIKNITVQSGVNGAGFFASSVCFNDPGEYSIQNVTLEHCGINGLSGADNQTFLVSVGSWSSISGQDPNNNKNVYPGCARVRNVTLKNCFMSGTAYEQSMLIGNHGTNTIAYFDNISVIGSPGGNRRLYNSNGTAAHGGNVYVNNIYVDFDGLDALDTNYAPPSSLMIFTNAYINTGSAPSQWGFNTITGDQITTPSTYSGFTFGNPWKMTDEGPTPTMLGTWELDQPIICSQAPLATSPNNIEWIPLGSKAEFIEKFGDPALGPYKNFYLTADIDFEGDAFMPSWGWSIGRWGWFDGRGHTIRNSTIPVGYGQAQSSFLGAACGYNRGGVYDTSGYTGDAEYSLQNLIMENIIDNSGWGNENFVTGLACYKNGTDVNNGQAVVTNGSAWPADANTNGVAPHVNMRNVWIRNCDIPDPGGTGNDRVCYLSCIGNDSYGRIDLFDVAVTWDSATPPVLARMFGGRRASLTRGYIDIKQYCTTKYWDNGAFSYNVYARNFTGSGASLVQTTVSDATYNLESSYPAFDFENIWEMDEINGPSPTKPEAIILTVLDAILDEVTS